MTVMYDPLKIAEETEKIVSHDLERKYYRFRPTRFYGGIATADCLGCCLRCIFCWAWEKVIRPDKVGRFYKPEEVVKRLVSIARKKRFDQVRISGNEPTIGKNHLLKILELIPSDLTFVLETNGILIGADSDLARELSRFSNLYVRVSLKGTDQAEFSRLTGAAPKGFEWQLQALKHLLRAGVRCYPSVMLSFSSEENIVALRKRLGGIRKDFADFEEEELVMWGSVEERLIKAKIPYNTAYHPKNIPSQYV